MNPCGLLVLFGHPAFHKSRVQRAMRDAVLDLPGVTFHDLYDAYPDLDIDVKREQELLLAHRHVILQHPFHWYGAPAIFKEWVDLVLEHGFAYGEGGHALTGKRWSHALSAGGDEAEYARDGSNRFTVRELLAPWEQTARLCGMKFGDPFVVHGALRLHRPEELARVGAEYRAWLKGLA